MDGAKPVITYEVHIKRKGQWEVHVRYPENRRVQAMGKAKSMARDKKIEEVKVIEDAYDPSTGSSTEHVVYNSDEDVSGGKPGHSHADASSSSVQDAKGGGLGTARKAKKKSPAKSKSSKSSGANSRKSSKRGKKPRRMTVVAFFTRLLLVLLFSIVIGMMFAGIASAILHRTSLGSAAQSNILFTVFVVAFLISVISMTVSLLSKADLRSRSAKRKITPTVPPPTPVAADAPAADEGTNVKDGLTREQIDAAEKAAIALAESMQSDEKDKVEDEKTPEEPEKKEDKVDTVSPQYKKQKDFASKFFDSVFKPFAGKLDLKKMDNFNKFGVNLFIAGACEKQAQARNIDGRTTMKLISEWVQDLGFKEYEANSFAEKYTEYLVADSRYMQMFQAGRNSMSTYIGGDDNIDQDMKKAIKEWNEPKAKEESASPVTVLFTDMVGSTALTQTKGDAVAQNVVHAHNRIVRDALRQYLGKEIKHTGDGIMASFSNTSNGVEASIAIQKNVALHNKSSPDLPLHLKIGINVGEPISEDNDLFGTTVQLSARIVDKASSEQIFVSEAVRGICAGKSINFVSRGTYDMKGFADPVTLYEVVWQEGESQDNIKQDAAADTPGQSAAPDKVKEEHAK